MNFMGTLLVIVLTCWLATVSFAVDHTRSVGEPYELAGKRMVFTNWLYIRPGQIDWLNDKGESVYSSGDIEAGPTEAHFDNYLAPWGIRIAAQPAQRGEPILKREKPWEQMGINGTTLINDNGKYR